MVKRNSPRHSHLAVPASSNTTDAAERVGEVLIATGTMQIHKSWAMTSPVSTCVMRLSVRKDNPSLLHSWLNTYSIASA